MMSDYVRRVNVWITKEQDDKIAMSGLDDSTFIREAIDQKDYDFMDMKRRMNDYLVDDLIKYLSDKKRGHCQTSCQTKAARGDEIVRQLMHDARGCQTNLSDKSGEIVRQTPEEVFGNELQTIVNILKTSGSLNKTQKDMISGRLGIKPTELQKRVDEYDEDIRKMNVVSTRE
jgi:hypothetical protein